MRKVLSLFLTVLLTMTLCNFAFAQAPSNIDEALNTANNELKSKYYGWDYFYTENVQGKPINEALWGSSSLFSYGTPQEASKGSTDFDPVTNQYRYHGHTMNGEKYTNTFFRNDSTNTININTSNWVRYPWLDTKVQKFVHDTMKEPLLEDKNPFNNDPGYLEAIRLGLENSTLYNPYMKYQRDSKLWYEYVHILQPASMYSFGMGRMFRQDASGNIVGYLTIPITPLKDTILPNFWTDWEGEIPESLPNEKVTVKPMFGLESDYPEAIHGIPVVFHNVSGTRYLVKMEPIDPNNALPENHAIKFQPGEIKEYMATITTQNIPTKIEFFIIGVKTPSLWSADHLCQIPDIVEQNIELERQRKAGGVNE